jgi:hypothetical protein
MRLMTRAAGDRTCLRLDVTRLVRKSLEKRILALMVMDAVLPGAKVEVAETCGQIVEVVHAVAW